MKYLKSINENLNIFNEEFVKECFIEFYDDEKIYEPEIHSDDDDYDSVLINIPELETYDEYNVEDFVNMSNDLYEFYHNIRNSITKVKMKYNCDVKMLYDQLNTSRDFSGKRYVEIKFYKLIN
jgi:hypothetical protein